MNENAKKYFIGVEVKESERYKKRMYGACTLIDSTKRVLYNALYIYAQEVLCIMKMINVQYENCEKC